MFQNIILFWYINTCSMSIIIHTALEFVLWKSDLILDRYFCQTVNSLLNYIAKINKNTKVLNFEAQILLWSSSSDKLILHIHSNLIISNTSINFYCHYNNSNSRFRYPLFMNIHKCFWVFLLLLQRLKTILLLFVKLFTIKHAKKSRLEASTNTFIFTQQLTNIRFHVLRRTLQTEMEPSPVSSTSTLMIKLMHSHTVPTPKLFWN